MKATTRAAALLHTMGVAVAMAAAATMRFTTNANALQATKRAPTRDDAGGYRSRTRSSNAKVKRAAQKRRNVLRNRRAHRG